MLFALTTRSTLVKLRPRPARGKGEDEGVDSCVRTRAHAHTPAPKRQQTTCGAPSPSPHRSPPLSLTSFALSRRPFSSVTQISCCWSVVLRAFSVVQRVALVTHTVLILRIGRHHSNLINTMGDSGSKRDAAAGEEWGTPENESKRARTTSTEERRESRGASLGALVPVDGGNASAHGPQEIKEDTPTSTMVRLNVGGVRFTTTLGTLRKYNFSLLASIFSGRHNMLQFDENGDVFLTATPCSLASFFSSCAKVCKIDFLFCLLWLAIAMAFPLQLVSRRLGCVLHA